MPLSADEIKKGRKKLRISQKKLAELVGVTAIAVHHWERGVNKASLDNTAKLRKLFKQGVPKKVEAWLVVETELKNIKISFSKLSLAIREIKKGVTRV